MPLNYDVRFLVIIHMIDNKYLKHVILILILVFGNLAHGQDSSESHSANDIFSFDIVRQSIRDTLELLTEVYVYPEKAKEIRIEIIRRMHQGSYDDIKTKEQFASFIGSELRAVSQDSHLGIMLVKESKSKPTHILVETDDNKKYNYAFQRVEVLSGNVGLMKFNKFYQDEEAKIVVDHAFGFLENTDAMIIDLRDCIGGSPELVRYMLSHFFKEETELWSIHERGNKSIHNHLSIEGLGSERFKSEYPLFILTGPKTASAAELFSYTLKHFEKAIIVGENSQGLAHLVGAEKINQYFIGRFSMARPVNPITKDSWEGVGVIPSITTEAEVSLEVAHAEALKSLAVSIGEVNLTKTSKAAPENGAL